MKDEEITSDFLIFNGISKLIDNANDLDEDELTIKLVLLFFLYFITG